MEKQDFDILLSPIKSSTNLKDVSLVKGIGAVGQKIRNLLYTTKGDRPFDSSVGTSLLTNLKNYGGPKGAILINNIISNIQYSIKETRNVSVNIKQGSAVNYIDVVIKFDYYSNDVLKTNNRLTVSINTIT